LKSEFPKLEHVAKLVVKRVILEVGHNDGLAEALERAYPFGDLLAGRSVWEAVIARMAPELASRSKTPSKKISPSGARSSGKPSKARPA
jgi:hypothetical protein